jgi:hypothetical protein
MIKSVKTLSLELVKGASQITLVCTLFGIFYHASLVQLAILVQLVILAVADVLSHLLKFSPICTAMPAEREEDQPSSVHREDFPGI